MTDFVAAWRRTIIGEGKSWVVFGHGTCVVLVDPDDGTDLAADAIALMRQWGPVRIGSPAGDFSIIVLEPGPGFVVTSHHNDLLTFVGPDEVPGPDGDADPDDLSVGLFGRHKRDLDAQELRVIHVEDRRAPEPR